MAVFAVYTYKFRDVENVGIFLGQEDQHEPLPTLEDKQNFLQSIFHNHLEGGREFECFTMESQRTSDNKITKYKTKYGVKVVWEMDGLVILMISNPYKKLTRHIDFKKIKEQDAPWCHVLIDNRYGREFMAIEKNSAFNTADQVAYILETSLREHFHPHHVTIEIKNQYQPDAFWEIIDKHKSNGIQEIAFHFAAPNHPWSTELLGSINNAAKSMKARATTKFSSPDGNPLCIDKSNAELNNYVDNCALEGEDIVIKVKGIRTRLHVKNVKDKYVFKHLSDDVFRKILKHKPELFESNFDELTAFLNQIKTTIKTS